MHGRGLKGEKGTGFFESRSGDCDMDAGEQDKNDERTLAQPSRPYSFHQPNVEEAAYGHETGDAGEGIGEQMRQFEQVEKYQMGAGDAAHQRTPGEIGRWK